MFTDRVVDLIKWIREPLWSHTKFRETLAHTPKYTIDELLKIQPNPVRIGSDSSNGKVYKIDLKEYSLALKVFVPKEGEDELSIATKLGNMTKEDQDLPFPISFGSGKITKEKHLKLFGVPRGAEYLVSELAAGDLVQVFQEAREAKRKGELTTWSKERMPLLFPNGVSTLSEWKKEIAFQAFCC